MARPAFTVRLGAVQTNLAGFWLLHTPRPDVQTVIRDVVMNLSGTGPVVISLFIRHINSDLVLAQPTLNTGVPFRLDMRQVIEVGDFLYLQLTAAQFVSVLVTGYELQGAGRPADAPIGPLLVI